MIIENIPLGSTLQFENAIYGNLAGITRRGVSASIVCFDSHSAVVILLVTTKSALVQKEVLITYNNVTDNWEVFADRKKYTFLSLTELSGVCKQVLNSAIAIKSKI